MIILHKAVLCLGTNIGNREENLNKAISYIDNLNQTKIIKKSSIYETEPFGVNEEQPNFYNCCVEIETLLKPSVLLGACLGIESALGRERPYRYAPRIIDIDIIAYENFTSNEEYLTLPHPRYKERAFVMIPLKDLFSDCIMYGDDFSTALILVKTDLRLIKVQ